MTSPEAVRSEDANVRAVIERWADALRRKDAKSVLSHMAPDYRHFSLAPPLVDGGTGAGDLDAWFQTWNGPLEFELRDLAIVSGQTVAFSHSLNRLAGTKAGDGRSVLWYRGTLGFRKIGNEWKIVHEHESVPFYMDGSMRAATDLKP